MTITIHRDIDQGSELWLKLRCGKLCASEMKKIITGKTLKPANNGEAGAHAFELAFQRISGIVEPQYISDAMLRGQSDEIYARDAYAEHFAPVEEVAFIESSRWGFTIGYSPDGLVGADGLIEIKSRCGKYQVETIAQDHVPDEYMIQLQTGLLVTGRQWIDFISYCGGLPIFVKRIEPYPEYQEAIVAAATAFEERVAEQIQEYHNTLARMAKVIPTERREEMELIL